VDVTLAPEAEARGLPSCPHGFAGQGGGPGNCRLGFFLVGGVSSGKHRDTSGSTGGDVLHRNQVSAGKQWFMGRLTWFSGFRPRAFRLQTASGSGASADKENGLGQLLPERPRSAPWWRRGEHSPRKRSKWMKNINRRGEESRAKIGGATVH